VTIAPLFLLYDYSFRTDDTMSKERRVGARAWDSGVVCTDEMVLFPDPYESRDAWCEARVTSTEERLAALDPELPVVLVNHFPLIRYPTRVLRYPQFGPVVRHGTDGRLAPPVQRGPPSCTGICTSGGPPGTTGCRSWRSRSDTPGSGPAPASRTAPCQVAADSGALERLRGLRRRGDPATAPGGSFTKSSRSAAWVSSALLPRPELGPDALDVGVDRVGG